MTSHTGELAALFTSVAWTFTSIFFTLSGREVGSNIVNRTRLLFALLMVTTFHWITQGQPFPFDAGLTRWGWMGLSGLIGFIIGDAMLFQAFVMIGPRLSMLLMSLNPAMGGVLAFLLLGEELTALQILGMTLAITGVASVVTERRSPNAKDLSDLPPRYYIAGILLGLGGALGQASGLIASKKGLEGDFSALSGNLMRIVVSTLVIWLITLVQGKARAGFTTLRQNPRALYYIIGGAIAGPFLGVWMSLVAVQNAAVGIASTLMSLSPIILLVPAHIFFKESITRRAVIGTIIAFTGTAILFLSP